MVHNEEDWEIWDCIDSYLDFDGWLVIWYHRDKPGPEWPSWSTRMIVDLSKKGEI